MQLQPLGMKLDIKAKGAKAGYTGNTPPNLHELLLLDTKLSPAEKSQSHRRHQQIDLRKGASQRLELCKEERQTKLLS